jgi:hypothetical protein
MLSVQRLIWQTSIAISILAISLTASADNCTSDASGSTDVVYKYRATDSSAGMDAMLSRDRKTISVGSFVFDLMECPSDGNLICLKSEYFNLVVPCEHSMTWSDGQYNFVAIGEQTLAFVHSSEPVLLVSSIQNHSLFTFYLTRAGKLLGWTQTSRAKGIPASYIAGGKRGQS